MIRKIGEEYNTDLKFQPIMTEDISELRPFFCLKPDKTYDNVFLDSFIQRTFYSIRYAVRGNKVVLWLMELDGVPRSAMPMCKEEDLEHYFPETRKYFNEELDLPLRIYLADGEAVNFLKLDPEKHLMREQEDLKDYLYDGETVRTLFGKKPRKRKSHLNAFVKEYESRYEYRRLCCSDRYNVWDFLSTWRDNKEDDVDEHLDPEVEGIHEILKNCLGLNIRMGGVYVDGKLEVSTIGGYNFYRNTAVIHIEKTNAQMRGLYQFINQQFLINEFPDVKLVNRGDDLGLGGLRKARVPYNPMGFARKYYVEQRSF